MHVDSEIQMVSILFQSSTFYKISFPNDCQNTIPFTINIQSGVNVCLRVIADKS